MIRPSDTLRSFTVVPDDMLRYANTNIKESIARQVERELTSKVFNELKTNKSIIVSLVKDGEVQQHDNFSTSITTDIKIFSVEDFIENITSHLHEVSGNRLNPFSRNSSDYTAGALDTLNLVRMELENIKRELEK